MISVVISAGLLGGLVGMIGTMVGHRRETIAAVLAAGSPVRQWELEPQLHYAA